MDKIIERLNKELELIENQIDDHDDSKWETEEFDIYRAKFHPEPGEEPEEIY